MRVLQVRQAHGAIRLIAVSDADATMVRDDSAAIECVTPLGVVDVWRDGRREWGPSGPPYRRIPSDVRALLSREMQGS